VKPPSSISKYWLLKMLILQRRETDQANKKVQQLQKMEKEIYFNGK